MMSNNYVVIMAGGIGSRFWPMSRTAFPKQFHDVLGIGKSLLQMTVERYEQICPLSNIYVVTNESYKDLVQAQLPFLEDNQILLEPSRKNTAPCIAYASYKIHQQNPNARLVIAPSDHLILKQQEFEKTIDIALEQAQVENCLITIGIKPSRPDTGYGYIQFENVTGTINKVVKKVKTFTEKPDIEIAKEFLQSGDFYWNSGMFIWTTKSILSAFEKHLPEIHNLFNDGLKYYNGPEEFNFINKIYPQCKNISIDYGVMESATNVYVILADLGWSDLGTWGSLYTHVGKDEEQNAIIGKRVVTYESEGNIIMMPKDKLAIIHGLKDFIVVESNNTLLICKKEDEQKIKTFVNDLKTSKNEQFI